MGWFKYSKKIKFKVNLISLFSWKEAGFAKMSTDLPSDIDFEVDTLDTFALMAKDRKPGFFAKPIELRRDFNEDMPEDLIDRIAVAVQNRTLSDWMEVRRCLGYLEYVEGPIGSDRAAWNIFNQSGNRFSKDMTYRMVFAVDKTDDKLGILLGTPTFFRDTVIKLGHIKPNLDIHSEPLKSYYQEL